VIRLSDRLPAFSSEFQRLGRNSYALATAKILREQLRDDDNPLLVQRTIGVRAAHVCYWPKADTPPASQAADLRICGRIITRRMAIGSAIDVVMFPNGRFGSKRGMLTPLQ